MVSDNYTQGFKAVHGLSQGIRAHLNTKSVNTLLSTQKKSTVNPVAIYARDCLHDPDSWNAIFKLFNGSRLHKSMYILTFIPFVEA